MANGHEWAKRRLTAAGIGFRELDNGLWTVEDPEAARRICASLGSGHLRGLINRWLPTLPSPLTVADRRAGFDWAWSIRQVEIADTAVFDRPAAGRAWFEAAIRDHVDLGRPDNVKVIFARQLKLRGQNVTPGSFTTQVITPGTRARIEIRYKTSGAKAYLKEGRALRVETTINNPEFTSSCARPSTATTGGRCAVSANRSTPASCKPSAKDHPAHPTPPRCKRSCFPPCITVNALPDCASANRE